MRLLTKERRPGEWLRLSWDGNPNTAVAVIVGEGPIVRAFFDRNVDEGPVMQIRCPDLEPGTYLVRAAVEEGLIQQVGRVKIR